MKNASSEDWKGRRVTVMGLGSFGGGVGVVRYLADRGARVTVTDVRTEEELTESLNQIEPSNLEALHLGRHREEDFRRADCVVVNPAVLRENRFLEIARANNVPLTSEMNLFWRENRGRVIGVTGSNGKSTTAALIHAILRAVGHRCRLGGNIGKSLLPVVEEIRPEEWVVLELSSFQLTDLDRLQASPEMAVVTNFSPNHLDWHGSLAAYRRAKQTNLRWQGEEDVAVVNQDDVDVSTWPVQGRRLGFGWSEIEEDGVWACEKNVLIRLDGKEQRIPLGHWLKVPGRHNFENAMAAVCAVLAVGIEAKAVEKGVKSFAGLPHRLQLVGEAAGRTFYNDSLATTPESACRALESFSQPVILLAGGYDKRVDLSAFAKRIGENPKAAALMGETADHLAELIQNSGGQEEDRYRPCSSFEEAFNWAVDRSEPGDVILLSPGCASYDWFGNFAERGDRFAQLAEEWCRRQSTRGENR